MVAADVVDRHVHAAQVELQVVVEHDLRQHDLEVAPIGDLDPDHVAAERDLLAGLDPGVERRVAPVERRLVRELGRRVAMRDDRHVERRAAEEWSQCQCVSTAARSGGRPSGSSASRNDAVWATDAPTSSNAVDVAPATAASAGRSVRSSGVNHQTCSDARCRRLAVGFVVHDG